MQDQGFPVWSAEFSVHHDGIDDQHKQLFALGHRVYNIVNNPQAPVSDLKDVIVEFFSYMKTHFRDEEEYMQAIGYPGLEEHRIQHRKILRDMADMVKNIRSIDMLKQMILEIAKDWLLVHVMREDMKIEAYRRESLENQVCETKYYYYICECPNKEHKLTESMHLFVSKSANSIDCKDCHKHITFKEVRDN